MRYKFVVMGKHALLVSTGFTCFNYGLLRPQHKLPFNRVKVSFLPDLLAYGLIQELAHEHNLVRVVTRRLPIFVLPV